MTADELSRWVTSIVGVVGLLVLLFGAGKAWAAVSAAASSLRAIHRRMDESQKEIEGIKLDVREIKTEMRIRSTLRFRQQAPEPPSGGPVGAQDMFRGEG